MKRLIAIISAILITVGLKAQNSNAQKETAKPAADMNTSLKANNTVAIKNTAVIKKEVSKDATFKNSEFKNAAIKNAEIKKAAVVADKAAPAKQ